MSEKTSFHIRGERQIRGDIKRGGSKHSGDYYQMVGREHDPRVAEAMAYAAKPLIDDTLDDLKLEPNSDGMATFEVDGEKMLNKLPGVVTPSGHEIPYSAMKQKVAEAHGKADAVQTRYYNRLVAAEKALLDAKNDI